MTKNDRIRDLAARIPDNWKLRGFAGKPSPRS